MIKRYTTRNMTSCFPSASLFCGEKDNECVLSFYFTCLTFQLDTFLSQGPHLFLV